MAETKYSKAIERLDEIISKIESDEIDVDELSLRVKEAVGLVKLCKAKIDKAEMEVKQVVDDLANGSKGKRMNHEGRGMIILYTILIVLVCFLVFINTYRVWFLIDARRRGKLPPRGKGTMFDVRHLLMEGEKELAIQLYCEIFQTTPIKAKKDIEELERSLKV